MNFKKIKEELLVDMAIGIRNVIDGILEKYENPLLCPNDVISHIENIGFIDLDQFDSNGWQYDNWTYFNHSNERYCVEGSGRYGGISFYKSPYEH